MISLNQLHSGQKARVTWIMGDTAEYICKYYGFHQDSVLRMIRNKGKSNMIVAYGPRRFILDADAAFGIKMELI